MTGLDVQANIVGGLGLFMAAMFVAQILKGLTKKEWAVTSDDSPTDEPFFSSVTGSYLNYQYLFASCNCFFSSSASKSSNFPFLPHFIQLKWS